MFVQVCVSPVWRGVSQVVGRSWCKLQVRACVTGFCFESCVLRCARCVLGCQCLQMLSAHVTARMIDLFASTLSNSNLSSRVCVRACICVCVCECECVCVWVYVPLLCPLGVCSLSLALSPTNAHTHTRTRARTHTHTYTLSFLIYCLPLLTIRYKYLSLVVPPPVLNSGPTKEHHTI